MRRWGCLVADTLLVVQDMSVGSLVDGAILEDYDTALVPSDQAVGVSMDSVSLEVMLVVNALLVGLAVESPVPTQNSELVVADMAVGVAVEAVDAPVMDTPLVVADMAVGVAVEAPGAPVMDTTLVVAGMAVGVAFESPVPTTGVPSGSAYLSGHIEFTGAVAGVEFSGESRD